MINYEIIRLLEERLLKLNNYLEIEKNILIEEKRHYLKTQISGMIQKS